MNVSDPIIDRDLLFFLVNIPVTYEQNIYMIFILFNCFLVIASLIIDVLVLAETL